MRHNCTAKQFWWLLERDEIWLQVEDESVNKQHQQLGTASAAPDQPGMPCDHAHGSRSLNVSQSDDHQQQS